MKALITLMLCGTIAGTAQCQEFLYDDYSGNLPPTHSLNINHAISADVNKDGFPDLIIANGGQHNSIFINNNGSFLNQSYDRLPNVFYDSKAVAAADFDNDFDIDLIFVSHNDSVHEIVWNDGNGYFSLDTIGIFKSKANFVITDDITNDNFPDLIIANDGQNQIYINNKNGTFSEETSIRYPAGINLTNSITLADLNGDGHKDLIEANTGQARILMNNGSGIFVEEAINRLPYIPNMKTATILVEDFDGDYKPDLFLSNVGKELGYLERNRYYKNDGFGIFQESSINNLPYDNVNSNYAVAFDIDYDGDLDIITSNSPNEMPFFYINNGTGSFEEKSVEIMPVYLPGNSKTLVFEDFNGDNVLDLFVGYEYLNSLYLQGTLSTKIKNDFIKNNSVLIYPNPTNSILQIELEKLEKAELKILDLNGKVLNSETFLGKTQINMEGFSKGVYIGVVNSDLGQQISKIIKN